MKAPSWMSIETGDLSRDRPNGRYVPFGARVDVHVRVKRWHPGFWLFVLRCWKERT